MRRSVPPPLTDPHEQEIKRLQSEIYRLRNVIVKQVPESLRTILTSYHQCESKDGASGWELLAADQVVQTATVLPHPEGAFLGDRAYCPLCGDGVESRYESGFSHPEGLRRHLIGWGNVAKCSIFAAAAELARYHLDHQFAAAERKSRPIDPHFSGTGS